MPKKAPLKLVSDVPEGCIEVAESVARRILGHAQAIKANQDAIDSYIDVIVAQAKAPPGRRHLGKFGERWILKPADAEPAADASDLTKKDGEK